jgi:hypothetical protein
MQPRVYAVFLVRYRAENGIQFALETRFECFKPQLAIQYEG